MKALFLVFHGFLAYNGISKKIGYQVDGLRQCGIDTRLTYLKIDENKAKDIFIEMFSVYEDLFDKKIKQIIDDFKEKEQKKISEENKVIESFNKVYDKIMNKDCEVKDEINGSN